MSDSKETRQTGEKGFDCGPMAECMEKMTKDPRFQKCMDACGPVMSKMFAGCSPSNSGKADDQEHPGADSGADTCCDGPKTTS